MTLGTDAGAFYSLYGFAYIREMELLQHAGFNPLEVVRSATHYGAETILRPKGEAAEFGIIAPRYLADLVVVNGNPLDDFKILYGTGVEREDPRTGELTESSSIAFTIKDGIVYDVQELLQDVRSMVQDAGGGDR
ncbi:MAG: amidohydrolase family protein [Acidobacteriota bacterium]